MGRLHILSFVGVAVLTGCNVVSNEQPVAIIVTSPPIMSCTELVASAIATANDACIEVDDGEACYGHANVSAVFQPNSAVRFSLPGDSADLNALQGISTSALSERAQIWGIAVMKTVIQEQAIKFILFGESTLDGIESDLSVATMSTGQNSSGCEPRSALMVQSRGDGQATLQVNGVDITLGSTVHITAVQNQAMTITNLDGAVVVAVSGATRILRPGAEVHVPLDTLSASGEPSQPVPYDVAAMRSAPLILLDRPIELPQPIAGPTVPPISSTLVTSTLPPVTAPSPETPTPAECSPHNEWTETYTVQRGDTLSIIARGFGLTTRELQEGNCIADPDLIRAGQVLAVPNETTSTTVPTGAPDATTPTPVLFRADLTRLVSGQCTTIRWDAGSATAVTFEEQISDDQGSQEVCPTETTTYRLVVTHGDGREVPYTLRIEVGAQPAATEDVD